MVGTRHGKVRRFRVATPAQVDTAAYNATEDITEDRFLFPGAICSLWRSRVADHGSSKRYGRVLSSSSTVLKQFLQSW